MSVCRCCGTTLPPSRGTRPRKWCSERCRKSQYDQQCIDCGTRIDGTTPGKSKGRCVKCAPKVPRPAYIRHRVAIEAMWADGLTLREICSILGQKYVKSILSCWRARGYDLPYRYSADRRANMLVGSDERMAKARAAKRAAA